MKQKHVDFIMKFHKPTSRHLYTLRDCGVIQNSELTKACNYI